MNGLVLFLLLPVALVASPAGAQLLPVTTSSKEALEHFEAGRLEAFRWQPARAQEHLDAAIAADSAFVLAYLHRAGTSRRSEREPYLERAEVHRAHISPGEARLVDAFRSFLLEDDYGRAIEILQGLSDLYPDDPYLPGYLGMRYFNHFSDYNEAARQFGLALERDSSFLPAYQLLGWAAMSREDYATAEGYLRENLRLAPNQPQSHQSMGELYRRTGRYDEAVVQFEHVLELDSDFYGGWIRPGWMRDVLGYAYMEAGRFDEAERVFRENVGRHPVDPNTYHSLGELYLKQDRHDEAARQFELALEVEPGFEPSYTKLARIAVEAKTEGRIRAANDALLNEGNVDAVPEFFLQAYVNHATDGDVRGPDVITSFVRALRDAFPDLRVEIEVLATEGDRVAWIRTHRGTHEGDFMGVPASGRTIVWRDMVVTRFEDSMIAEEWGVSELGARLRAE